MDLRSIILKRIAEMKADGYSVSHASIAKAIGIHRVTLSRFLTGKTNLSSEHIESLLEHLSLDVVVDE